jgi:hypothetical protein
VCNTPMLLTTTFFKKINNVGTVDKAMGIVKKEREGGGEILAVLTTAIKCRVNEMLNTRVFSRPLVSQRHAHTFLPQV